LGSKWRIGVSVERTGAEHGVGRGAWAEWASMDLVEVSVEWVGASMEPKGERCPGLELHLTLTTSSSSASDICGAGSTNLLLFFSGSANLGAESGVREAHIWIQLALPPLKCNTGCYMPSVTST